MTQQAQFPVEKIILSEALLRLLLEDRTGSVRVESTTQDLSGEFRVSQLTTRYQEIFELSLSCGNEYFGDFPDYALISLNEAQQIRISHLKHALSTYNLLHVADFNSGCGQMDLEAYRPISSLENALPITQCATYVYKDYIRFRAEVNHPEINDIVVLADRLPIKSAIDLVNDDELFSLSALLNCHPKKVYVEHATIEDTQLIQLEDFLAKFSTITDDGRSFVLKDRQTIADALFGERWRQLKKDHFEEPGNQSDDSSSEQFQSYKKYLEQLEADRLLEMVEHDDGCSPS